MSYTYEYLTNIETIVSNYNVEILRDKLKSNSYLEFQSGRLYFEGTVLLKRLFQKINQESNENMEFYQHLFKSQYKEFLDKQFLNQIIQDSNLVALKAYQSVFGVGGNQIDQLISSMVIYDYQGLDTIKSYRSFKLLSYLVQKNIINSSIIKIQLPLYHALKEIKLGQLIEIIKFFQMEKLFFLDIKQDLLDFTSDQLNLNIKLLLKSSTKNNRSKIFQILEMISIYVLNSNLFLFKVNKIIDKLQNIEDYIQIYNKDRIKQVGHYLNQSNYNQLEISVKDILLNGSNQDLEFIENLISKSKANKETFDEIFNNRIQFEKILPLIKNNSVLDFYFKNYQHLAFKMGNSNWEFVSSLSVFEHYQSLMKSINHEFSFSNTFKTYDKDILTFEILERFANNPHIYFFDSQFKLENYFDIVLGYFNNGKSQQVISFYKALDPTKRICFCGFSLANKAHKNIFLDWVFKNFIKISLDSEYMDFQIDLNQSSNSSSQTSPAYLTVSMYYFEVAPLLYNRLDYTLLFKFLDLGLVKITPHFNFEIIRIEFIDQLFKYILEKKDQLQQLQQHQNASPLSIKETLSIEILEADKLDEESLIKRIINDCVEHIFRIVSFAASSGNLKFINYILSNYRNQLLYEIKILSDRGIKSILKQLKKQSSKHPNYNEIIKLFSTLLTEIIKANQ